MEDESEEECSENEPEGFCHFNESSGSVEFSLALFGHTLVLAQNPVQSELGHGACVWDASIIFSKYVEHSREFSPSVMRGKTVLELGAGCGLAGIALMLRGAAVTLTDLPAVTSQLTHLNAMRVYNQFIGMGSVGSINYIRPIVTSIDWTDHSSPQQESPFLSSYDFILLTDCVFKRSLAYDLVFTIRKYSSRQTEVICCHEIRDEDANAAFVEELSKFYKLKRVSKDKLHPDFRNDQVVILMGKPLRDQRNAYKEI